jgi:hypothetical protein
MASVMSLEKSLFLDVPCLVDERDAAVRHLDVTRPTHPERQRVAGPERCVSKLPHLIQHGNVYAREHRLTVVADDAEVVFCSDGVRQFGDVL